MKITQRSAMVVSLVYGAAGALWVFFSDALLGRLAPDPTAFTTDQIYKGWAFVGATAALLFLMLSRQGRPARTEAPDAHHPRAWVPILSFIIMFVAIACTGAALYFEQTRTLLGDTTRELQHASVVKAHEVRHWLAERRGDANVFSRGSMFALQAGRWLDGGAPADQRRQQLAARLAAIRSAYDYAAVLLLDAQGSVRLSASAGPLPAHSVDPELARAALARGTVQFGGLRQAGAGQPPWLDMAAPLQVRAGAQTRSAGALYFIIDPVAYLFPLIQHPPLSYHSAESLLVRRQGNRVLLLNAPRLEKAPDLPMSQPLSRTDEPAVWGANRVRRSGRGVDYRGVAVLGATAPVAGTDWSIVSKVDVAEIEAPLRRLAARAGAVASLFIFVAGVAIALWWRAQRARYEARHLRSQIEREALAHHYDYLSRFANDIILLADESGRFIEANDRAVSAYGYSREELLSMRGDELRAPAQRTSFEADRERLIGSEGLVYQTVHQRRDGSTFPVEISARLIERGGRKLHQGIVRDITERKLAERRIQRLTALYAFLSQTNQAIVRLPNRDELFPEVCEIAVTYGGFLAACIGMVDESRTMLTEAARAGTADEYLDSIAVSVDPNRPDGSGPSGRAFRERTAVICNDFQHDASTGPWRESAARSGIGASAALPLLLHGEAVGVLSLYAAEAGYFDQEIVATLEEMARDINFALDNIERERERAESTKRLAESEERYRSTMDAAQTGVCIIQDGLVRYANPYMLKLLGYTAAEMLDRLGLQDLLAPEDRARVAGNIRQRIAGVPGSPYEIRALCKDGTTVTAMVSGQRVLLNGRPAVVGTIVDITERKAAERELRHQKELLQTIFDNIPVMVVFREQGTDKLLVNAHWEEVTGWSEEETRKRDVMADLYPEPSELARVREFIASAPQPWTDFRTRTRRRGTIDTRWTSIRLSDGGNIAIGMDVTARKRSEEQQRLAARVFDASHDAIVITDTDGDIITVNPAFTNITGYAPEEVLQRNPRLLKSDRHDRAFYDHMWGALKGTGYWAGEIWNRRKNGEIYPEWLSISAVSDDRGEITHYVGIFSDVSDWKQIEERIHYLAHYDALTGLANRTLLGDRLEQALHAAKRHSRYVAVLFLDLDHFKDINDSMGHAAGDALLGEVAERLNGCVRSEDTVSRQGGDEFVVILADLKSAEDAAIVAAKIISRLVRPLKIEDREFYVTTSIGISVYPTDGTDTDSLLRNADAAMYHAKSGGRNNFQFYTADMNRRAVETVSMEAALRRALEHGEFALHYQPQVDIASGRITGAEALIRWQDPEQGLISPGAFIPVAEQRGLIIPIGEWVLHSACAQNRAWQDAGLPAIPIAVNISALQFRTGRLAEVLAIVLSRSRLAPEHLELELTESILMQDAEATLATLAELRRMGLQLSVDDFGTGYSSLNYLRRFDVHKLKIDQSFVHDVAASADAAAIARTIISMARSLKLATIAEGVETPEQIEFLHREGCAQAQGYLFSRPLPPNQFAALLERGSVQLPALGDPN